MRGSGLFQRGGASEKRAVRGGYVVHEQYGASGVSGGRGERVRDVLCARVRVQRGLRSGKARAREELFFQREPIPPADFLR